MISSVNTVLFLITTKLTGVIFLLCLSDGSVFTNIVKKEAITIFRSQL
jgi:hypothetical protein